MNIVIYVDCLLERQYLTASKQSYLEALFKMNPYTIKDNYLEKFSKQLGLPEAKILDWREYGMLRSQHQGTCFIDKNAMIYNSSFQSVFTYKYFYVHTIHFIHINE